MAYFPTHKPNTEKVNEALQKSILKVEEQLRQLKICAACEHDWEMEIRETKGGPTIDRHETWFCKKCNLKR